jgi:hypothetical protein
MLHVIFLHHFQSVLFVFLAMWSWFQTVQLPNHVKRSLYSTTFTASRVNARAKAEAPTHKSFTAHRIGYRVGLDERGTQRLRGRSNAALLLTKC